MTISFFKPSIRVKRDLQKFLPAVERSAERAVRSVAAAPAAVAALWRAFKVCGATRDGGVAATHG